MKLFKVIGFGLTTLSCLAGCGNQPSTRIDDAESTATRISADQSTQQRIKASITDPIYDVAEAACRYKKVYGHWPSVEFYTNPDSPFVSFYTSNVYKKDFETAFQLKSFPSRLEMIVSLDEADGALGNCRFTLTTQYQQKKFFQFHDIPQKNPQPTQKELSFFVDRALLGTESDRDAFFASFFLVASRNNIPIDDSKLSVIVGKKLEEIRPVLQEWGVPIKLIICIALRVNANQCY